MILAPESAKPGELIKLRAQLVNQQDWKWLAGEPLENPPTFLWVLANSPEGYEIGDWIFQEGRTCVFATNQPGTYRFVLASTYLDAEGNPHLVMANHTLSIQPGEPPAPMPNPFSPPHPRPNPPVPNFPEGRFGLARWTWRSTLDLVAADHRALAHQLAENYRGIAARIAAGTLTAATEILSETTLENRRLLGEGTAAWMPLFEKLAIRMREIDQAKQLATPEDFRQAWLEIAMGFEAAAK